VLRRIFCRARFQNIIKHSLSGCKTGRIKDIHRIKNTAFAYYCAATHPEFAIPAVIFCAFGEKIRQKVDFLQFITENRCKIANVNV